MHSVGEIFDSWNLAWAFPADTHQDVIEPFSRALIFLQQSQGLMDELDQAFVKVSRGRSKLDR
jgi:hypothetical protein